MTSRSLSLCAVLLVVAAVCAAANQPPYFERNIGQTDQRVRYIARAGGEVIFLMPAEVVTRTWRMALVGANREAGFEGLDALPGRSNYFIGNDPARWRRDVPHYASVRACDVYRDIDLVFHAQQNRIEYDFVVAPGANPASIRLAFDPGDNLTVDDSGNLLLRQVKHGKPSAYQEIGGARTDVEARYVVDGDGEVHFAVGDYDREHALVIDPLVIYSTFIGGTSRESGQSVAVDPAGFAYVTGMTKSIDFPIHPSPQNGSAGLLDAFVTKINPLGSAIVYSTYLGGSSDDEGFGIAIDTSGRAYVTGVTKSIDFPTAGALQAANAGDNDGFVTVLTPSGTALHYSTYIGGENSDIPRGIAVHAENAHIVGETWSRNFPAVLSMQPLNGSSDAFVTRINPAGTAIVWSTFLGGSLIENGNGIATGSLGEVFAVGDTTSPDFPVENALQPSNQGLEDAFVVKLRLNLSAATGPVLEMLFGTYLGGSSHDSATGVAVDGGQNPYVTGHTSSPGFPSTSGAVQPNLSGSSDAFVTKLRPDGSVKVYSTFLGGGMYDAGHAIAVTSAGHATVVGHTWSNNFPMTQSLMGWMGSADGFFARLNLSGTAFTYSTYYGGSNADEARGVAILPFFGRTVVCGVTMSSDLPTHSADAAGPLQPSFMGFWDVFAVKLQLYKLAVSTSSGFVTLSKLERHDFQIGGQLLPDRRTNTFDLRRDDVVVTFGNYSKAIAGGSFRRVQNYFEFTAPDAGLRLVRFFDDGTYEIQATRVNLGPVTLPGSLPFEIQIGDDVAYSDVSLDSKGGIRTR
jgi:hypothetical protein